jgi:WD40 repeat protein
MSIRLWHLDNANFEHMKTLLGHTFPITCLQTFLNDGIRFLASACQNHEIKIWNPRSAGKQKLVSFFILNKIQTQKTGNELVVTLLGHF